jgi:hypothetical protein
VHAIIYIPGRSFSPAHDGQAKRLQIVSEFLAQTYPHHPRYLIAPVPPLPETELLEKGWQWIPVSSAASLRPLWRRALWRFWLALSWRFGNRRGAEMLGLVGSNLRLGELERRFFASKPGALVLVGRCEFAGMVNFRFPGQRWILDTNDSVTNLEEKYHFTDKWRRLLFTSQQAWLSQIKATEYQFARKYDRIINISEEDHRFFSAAAPEKAVIEDTDIVLPENLPELKADYDVGFLGGAHGGSLSAAKNLISLAQTPAMSSLRFAIAGRVCETLEGQMLPQNVFLLGTVEDSLGFLRRCRCLVMFAGPETGASVKFQEALAAGCIIIANRNAARFSLAKAGVTHLETETLEGVAQLLSTGAVWNFKPCRLNGHFTRTAFHQRFAQAINGPSGSPIRVEN